MESESIPMIGEKKLVDTPITFMPCMMVPNCSEKPQHQKGETPFFLGWDNCLGCHLYTIRKHKEPLSYIWAFP
jgi:hypothetical protein